LPLLVASVNAVADVHDAAGVHTVAGVNAVAGVHVVAGVHDADSNPPVASTTFITGVQKRLSPPTASNIYHLYRHFFSSPLLAE